VVAARCHAKEGIMNAFNAGVKTIKHGSYLDEECVALMKQKDVISIATASVIEGGTKYLDELPARQAEKLSQVAVHSREGIQTCCPERR
jgi:imidazolonepropionase-like amidohydrolase